MKPVVHGLEADYGDQVDFVYLDVDDPATAELKAALGYSKQPEMYLVGTDGTVVAEWSGMAGREAIERGLQGVLN